MEEKKRGRGRPRLDVPNGRCSRRQAVNSMYMFEAVQLISEAAAEIPDKSLLWYSDETTWTIKSKDGILEQIGRMLIQDHHEQCHCVYITNLAIAALKKRMYLPRNRKSHPQNTNDVERIKPNIQ